MSDPKDLGMIAHYQRVAAALSNLSDVNYVRSDAEASAKHLMDCWYRLSEDRLKERHQGWTNRETWAVYLYIGNEEPLYRHWRSRALELTRADQPNWKLGEELKTFFTDLQESTVDGGHRDTRLMLYDIGSLWRVDWDAVAKALSEV